jgi:hypothetical protein
MGEENFQTTGEKILSSLSRDWPKETHDRLWRMIDYAIKRQDWYEDQRNKVLSLGIALLGLASFLVGGLLTEQAGYMPLFRLSAVATLIALVLTATSVIYEYVKGGSSEYTHRELADIRSWFFAYTVRKEVLNAAVSDPQFNHQNKLALLDAWKEFVQQWSAYQAKDTRSITEDLQQVFILFLFQAMKRNSLRTMIERVKIGSYWIAILLTITIILAAIRC